MNTKRCRLLVSSLLLLAAVTGLQAAKPGGNSVVIHAQDTMKFSVTKFEARAGEKLTVTLQSDGKLPKQAMGHNWILLKAGVDPVAYATASAGAQTDNFQPKSQKGNVLAAIPLLGPNESGSVTFTVPSVPGTYVYLCTFPGHCLAGMRGVMVVK